MSDDTTYTITELADGQQILSEHTANMSVTIFKADAPVKRTAELDVTDEEFRKLQKQVVKKQLNFDTLKLKRRMD